MRFTNGANKKAEINEVLKRFTYKPGWKIRWEFSYFTREGGLTLRISYPATCAVTGEPTEIFRSQEFQLSEFYAEEDLIQRLHTIVIEMELHEVNEWFKVNGVAPFYPHKKERPT